MKTSIVFAIVMLVLAVIGAIFYGGYYAVGYLWGLYASLDVVIRIVLLSSVAALLIGSLIIAGAVKASTRAAKKARLMEAKLNLYKSLVRLYEQSITNPQEGKTEILEKLSKLKSEVLILASSSVLNIHGKLESYLNGHQEDNELTDLYQQLIKCIRRDLGHSPIYDESKLKLFITSCQHKNADRHGSDDGLLLDTSDSDLINNGLQK